MVYENATTDDLKERGTSVTAIIMKKNDQLIDIFFENEKENGRFQIAKNVDFVDIYGITKDNDIYYTMMMGEGEIYIADNILYTESTEERFKTFTILIPIY